MIWKSIYGNWKILVVSEKTLFLTRIDALFLASVTSSYYVDFVGEQWDGANEAHKRDKKQEIHEKAGKKFYHDRDVLYLVDLKVLIKQNKKRPKPFLILGKQWLTI